MALIKCSECGKEISDKAAACVHCGNPISRFETEKVGFENIECPEHLTNLDVGKRKTNWTGSTTIKGYLDVDDNTLPIGTKSGDVRLWLHENGIAVTGKNFVELFSIHDTQIVSLQLTDTQELADVGKGVVKKAVVGHLLFGPVGAMVGGMSGMGDKKKLKTNHYLLVNYWSLDRQPKTLIIRGKPSEIKLFIDAREKGLKKA